MSGFRDSDDDDVDIDFDKVKAKTKKAYLFVIDGEEHWVPISQIVEVDETSKVVTMTDWIAEEKGLV